MGFWPLECVQRTGIAKRGAKSFVTCSARAQKNMSEEPCMFDISRSIQSFPERFTECLSLQLTVLRVDLMIAFFTQIL